MLRPDLVRRISEREGRWPSGGLSGSVDEDEEVVVVVEVIELLSSVSWLGCDGDGEVVIGLWTPSDVSPEGLW